MTRPGALLAALAAVILMPLSPARAADEPRTILGLYSADPQTPIEIVRIFNFAEMPLNHFGLVLEAYDVDKGVPSLAGRDDLRGVLVWLANDEPGNPDAVVALIADAAARDIPVVILEYAPGAMTAQGADETPDRVDRALRPIGIRNLGGWRPYTFDMTIVSIDQALAGFERPFDGPLPPVDNYLPTGEADAALTLERADGTRTSPILITPKGAFVAADYAIWLESDGGRALWRVDPFFLFSRVYRTDALPKADPTTLSGRRLYYSHIDGDGWRNVSTVEGYRKRAVYSSQVVMREVIKAYPDLPVTVAPIAADLDPAFAGGSATQQIASDLFALAQVEPASHTYTHPFRWKYFGPGYSAENERAFLPYYKRAILEGVYEAGELENSDAPDRNPPRAYGDIPFDLNKEIAGSARYISGFAPDGKAARLIQWSGSTSPFEEALAATRDANLFNINGGDSRFDDYYPSYTAVAPFGRRVGKERQIYASQANDNIYTDGWSRNFSGFRHLLKSLARTDDPRRVAAANVYYHMFSGEREASLRALKSVLDAMQQAEIAPVFASRYAAMAAGFYTARFEKAGPLAWRIRDRGALPTVRFDAAAALGVDYARSEGVLGHRRKGDSLYIALDGANAAPLVALKAGSDTMANRLVLHDSRWEIRRLDIAGGAASFLARGFGNGEMRWRARPGERWRIEADYSDRRVAADAVVRADGILAIALPRGGERGVAVRMTRVGGQS